MGDIIPAGSQGQLPEEYRTASIQQLVDRIHAVKQTLGECVVVLCGCTAWSRPPTFSPAHRSR